MKRVLVLCLVLAMVAGCATFQSFFCSPTAAQQSQAQTDLDAGQAAIVSLSPIAGAYPPAAAAIAGINLAIPVLKMIIAGTCVAVQDYQNAHAAVQSAPAVVKMAKEAKLIH